MKVVTKISLILCVLGFVAPVYGADTNASEAQTARKTEQSASKTEQNADKKVEWVVPEVPQSKLDMQEALRVRQSLELIREDILLKLKLLSAAKENYDRTKKDVEEKLQAIKEQNKLLDETLQKEKDLKNERLKEALVFIEKMEPRKAAPVVEAMDKDLVIALFKKLPPRNVTRILENVSPQKATQFMEYYTRIRSGREYSLLRELGLCQPEGEEGNKQSPPQQGSKPNENTQNLKK